MGETRQNGFRKVMQIIRNCLAPNEYKTLNPCLQPQPVRRGRGRKTLVVSQFGPSAFAGSETGEGLLTCILRVCPKKRINSE